MFSQFKFKDNLSGEKVPLMRTGDSNSTHLSIGTSHIRMVNYGSFGPPSIAGKTLSRDVDPSVFTNEGKGLIDFILAYQPLEMDASQRKYRETFEKKLRREGLYLETENLDQSQDGKTCFVKIHAPWETLARMAEINRVKIPIQRSDIQAEEEEAKPKTETKFIECFCCGKDISQVEPELQAPFTPTFFTLEFNKNRLRQYLVQDANTFFTQIQRIRLVWDIIERATVQSNEITSSKGTLLPGHREGESVTMSFLLEKGIYVAAYCMHDGDLNVNEDNLEKKPSSTWPLRPWLYETWARPRRWYKAQPIDQIRAYFGEKVGLYFAWLGFYTQMLIPLTVLGVIVLIYGLITFSFDVPMKDFCFTDLKNTVICRKCASPICDFTQLSSGCMYAMINAVFNNYSTMAFAIISSLWAMVFLEFWKREQARLTTKWDTYDVETEYETPRPDYQAAAKSRRRNPITHEWEPYIPVRNIWKNLAASFFSVTFMVCLALAVIASIITYKIVMVVVYYNMDDPAINLLGSDTFTMGTSSVISAISIMILEKVYTSIAWKLTEKEYPRTISDFEASYTYKMFLFQFVNLYATLFYLSFFQGSFAGSPNTDTLLSDRCPPAGCMFSVTTQLAIVLVGKQVVGNIMEIGVPMLKNYMKRRKNIESTEDNLYARWEKDFDLEPLPTLSLFPEYFEMVMQFGFVTMFVAAFPLAPLFALLNNIIEIRLDAYKFVGESRRVLPFRSANIGTWYDLLEVIGKIAVLTNGLLIAFTTDLLDRIYYSLVESPDGTLNGFVSFVLSPFDTSDWDNSALAKYNNVTLDECKFRGYYSEPSPANNEQYVYSPIWWRMMVVRLAFVIIFEHAIFGLQGLIQYIIPDVPEEVNVHMQRNRYVSKAGAALVNEQTRAKQASKSPSLVSLNIPPIPPNPQKGSVETMSTASTPADPSPIPKKRKSKRPKK